MEIAHEFITTNGIKMHVAHAGEGPLVLFCHGWPESWYSWRHQLKAIAAAGYRAVAPDMRGYGQTDKPQAIDQYTLLHLNSLKETAPAFGGAEAVLVGGYPQSKGKSSADLLKELPCGAAVVAVEKSAIVTIKKSQGEKRRKHHWRRSQQ